MNGVYRSLNKFDEIELEDATTRVREFSRVAIHYIYIIFQKDMYSPWCGDGQGKNSRIFNLRILGGSSLCRRTSIFNV